MDPSPTRAGSSTRTTSSRCAATTSAGSSVIKIDTDEHIARWHRAFVELHAADRFVWMLAGHTHQMMLRRFDHLGIVNAGTLSQVTEAGFLRIDFGARSVEHFRFGAEGAEIVGSERLPLP